MEFAKCVTPSLQTLTRMELVITEVEEDDDPLAGLCDELAKIAGNNKLESLEFEIDIQRDKDCPTGDEWGRLEKVLLKPGWPMLKHVSVAILFSSYNRQPLSENTDAIKKLGQT
jgi:hypothetical protein